ncbi:transposase [Bradyrhizobium sp. Arg237L]|uniref:transposase n=1 Tax=Bradyrhizobium sp. Arg237L TaxID=3003352 RepID=UPI00249E6BA4|nr:transposase [Bradyrhizobium sp. Arg237L]MDI4235887.1 transposase [Bradyrhizobium sp. Arg237L]
MDVRIRQAERSQPGFELVDLESLVVDEHPVRAVWSFVEGLDLQCFYDRIKARGEAPGRPATDPRILLALWLYATADGIGAARALARLCEHHTIYRWICGGVGVNHTMLSEFRLDSGEFLDRLLTNSLAALMKQGLITLDEVITDGTKVRAAASRSSMRRRQTLTELEEKARIRVAELKQELEADSAAGERRLLRRRLSAAEDRARRVAAALAKPPATAKEETEQTKGDEPPAGGKGGKHPKQERVSTTDPDAPLMKMADGAVRPAYNVQVASACGFVVAIEPVQRRNDRGLAPAMVAQVEQRCGKLPDRLLADIGAMTAADIGILAQTHPSVQVFSPPPARKDASKPESKARYERNRAAEPQCLKEWRARMDSPEGQAVYKRRSNTEHVHARLKNRGFGRMVLRGLAKVRIACLLHAVTHNLIWAISRRALKTA